MPAQGGTRVRFGTEVDAETDGFEHPGDSGGIGRAVCGTVLGAEISPALDEVGPEIAMARQQTAMDSKVCF